MNIDSILTEWTFRLEHGYPTKESDYDDLHDVIMEMTDLSETEANRIVTQAQGLNESNESSTDDLADIFSSLGGLTKFKQFDVLAKYTAEHYQAELGDIYKLFPTGINVIDNFEDYIDPEIRYKSGEDIEVAIVNWAIENNISAKRLSGQVKGIDIYLDGKPIEVKSSSKENKINTLLQTSFYSSSPDKFYIFATSQGSKSLKLLIVSSQLLRKLSLGEDIYNELENANVSEKLSNQISDGLQKIDFASQISAAIIDGKAPEGYEKSFYLGKNVKVRFLVYIEPTGLFDKEY